MNDNPNSQPRKGLSPAERAQIGYLLRFLAAVLFFVIVASLTVGFIVTNFLQPGG